MPQYVLGYVYQIGDFDTAGSNIAPQNEQGARAQGSPPFDLTLNSGTVHLQLVIEDDDPDFHETGGTDPLQELVNPVTIDGVTYPAGGHVILNYVLTDDNGFEGFSITIGSNNNGGNTTTAFITDQPMMPGQTYTFTSEGNIGTNNARPYSEFACFTAGTLIETPDGPRRIETLLPGDLVLTVDNGPQPLRWIGKRTVQGVGKMAPVTLRAGMCGATADLTVSPSHRFMVESAMPELLTGCESVLVAAKHLGNGRTITQTECDIVTYVHLLFVQHEIVMTQGCPSESYFLGEDTNRALNNAQSSEICALFPSLETNATAVLVHPEARAFEAALIRDALAA